MARATALWWWIDRWRRSSAFINMTLEEQGAYRNLLDAAALQGGALPNDDRVIANASGDAVAWRRLRSTVMKRFTLTADGWRNETLDEVLAESERRSKKQRDYRNGRRNTDGNENGNAVGNETRNAALSVDGNK